MYKTFLLFFCISLVSYSQVRLNKDLLYGMTPNEVKEVLANDKSYASIEFSNDVIWSISFEDMIFEHNKLVYIVLKPAENFYGINYIKTLNHIRTSKEYLQKRAYVLIDEHPMWNRPQAYVNENAAYVSLLENVKRNLVVKLDVERFKGSYMPSITITHEENKNKLTTTEPKESSSGF